MKIRQAVVEDADVLFDIEISCHQHPWSLEALKASFGERYHNAVLLCDDKIAGFYIANVVVDECNLFDIAVSPCFQGQGFGKQLMSHLEKMAREKECVSIWLEVRESNTPAISLYEACDYREVDKRPNYYPTSTGREAAIIMCKELKADLHQ